MLALRLCLTLVGLALAAPMSASAAPIDDFTDPGVIAPAGGSVQVNTSTFTVQGGEPFAAVTGCPERAKTAWFRVPGNGLPITVATDATTFDTILAAYGSSGVTIGSRLACDGDQFGNSASITFPTERGTSYLVQAGGKNNGGGVVRLLFSVTRPANDDRADALPVGTGVPVQAEQAGATQEDGEVLTCGDSDLAGTVWFRYTAAEAVDPASPPRPRSPTP